MNQINTYLPPVNLSASDSLFRRLVFFFLIQLWAIIRCSDGYWAGLSSHMVAELLSVGSMKTTSGRTRGRGTAES